MKISLVITALNHEDSIMEATESVLTQTRLPDEFGMVIGPCLDRTREFVEFYRDEIDFAYFPDEIPVVDYGFGPLRLDPLHRLEGEYVLYLPAHSIIYPRTLEQIEMSIEQSRRKPDVVFSPMQVFPDEGGAWKWGITSLGIQSILSLGPIHSTMSAYQTGTLRQHRSKLETLDCGPFSNLAWVLQVLSGSEAHAVVQESPIGEVWSFVQGDHCWTQSVRDGVQQLLNHVERIVPDEVDVLEEWISEIPTEIHFHDLISNQNHSFDEVTPEQPWHRWPTPFPE